jgi:hypothetical protein
MFVRLQAQIHEIRLDLHGRWLRRQERLALRRLGEMVARGLRDGDAEADSEEVRRLTFALAEGCRRLETMAAERAASLAADRADYAEVAPWMRPVVILRGLSARAVLRHQSAAARRQLNPHYEALGLAIARSGADGTADLVRTRATLERLRTERERRLVGFEGTAHPAWMRHAGTEAHGLVRAIVSQLRSALVPKLPALAGLAVGWWIANTYTDSHVRSVLRSVGIGSGGTRVVSGSTYKAMSFWLPLLAAALCAYLGERIAQHYRSRRLPQAG